MQLPSATSPGKPPSLPDEWVDRIFDVMENRYLAKWFDAFGGIPPDRVKAQWARELADFAPQEIKRGLEADKPWPPTLPEFKLLCRPVRDPKTEWIEAVEQYRIRIEGEGRDVWSRPQVYWAAVTVGNHDLQSLAWDQIKVRWERALGQASDKPVPAYLVALPEPGRQTVTREDGAKRAAQLAASIENIGASPSKQWAYRLLEREANGERLCQVSAEFWRETLGVARNADAQYVRDSLKGGAA